MVGGVGEEQQPLQEALQGAPAAPQPGAASQAASLAGGVPPSTPPRGFAAANGSDPDLAAGMPITPAPSLSKECVVPPHIAKAQLLCSRNQLLGQGIQM